MTPFRHAVVGQDYSARRLVADQLPAVTHLAEGRVLVSVGTTLIQSTPEGTPHAMAHFCSARFQLLHLLKAGDGQSVRQDSDYAVVVPKLWVPPAAGFLMFEAHIRPNGQLVITPDATVAPLFLPIPRRLMEQAPWAYAGGRFSVAKCHGYRYLDDAIAAKGELLKI